MEKGRLLQNKNMNKAIQVSKITLIINLSLSLLKFAAGYIGKSSAMLSDAVHSASDVLSTIVVMVGIKISEKQPDREHPYGHERMECVASIILSVALAITGAGIGYSGIKKIFSGQYNTLSVSSGIALTAAVLSIVIKEWMYWFTRSAAKHTNSDALMADAWHHRSDALSSVGSLIGILGVRLGYAIFDPIASVVICGCILKAALDIFKESIESLTTFTFAQYDFWVTDEFASNFRKMLILEQYRNLKMNMLYQKCLVNGPISYIEDIFNEMIKKGVHMTLYTITDWMGLVPIVVCLIFAGIGLVQLIKRRSLFKVDSDIIILGVYYGIVILAYSIFEIIPINYRPILIEGVMEASYPSSTTLLILCVMPTLIEQIQRRLTCVTTKRIITITVIAFSVFMVIGRLISGVHWFTDIVGGVILSMGLFTIYKAVVMLSTKNQ